MGTDGWLLTIIYVLCVVFSAYFAASESAYAGLNKIRMRNLAENGDKRAKSAIYIADRFDRALATILVCNNVAHIGGASIATILSIKVFTILKEKGDVTVESAAQSAIATAVTTIIICIAGEMLPKRFANTNNDKLALAFAPSMKAIMFITFPVAILFTGLNRLLSMISGDVEEPTVTEEELSTIIENVEDEGVIDEEQGELLQSALEFSRTTVADILTLHDDVVYVDVSMKNEQILAVIRENKFSRMPVCDGDIDNVVGILLVRNFLRKYINGEHFNVRDIMTKPYFVRLEDIIDDQMNEMSRSKNYMAVVKDKNGKTMGIVTVEDFLEELVGEIWDEDDVVDDNFIKLGGNRFDVSGAYSLGEMLSEIGCESEDASLNSKSVQSWVLESLGHLPEPEDEFVWGELTVTVTDVEENHVKRVEVKLETPELEVELGSDDEAQSGSEEEISEEVPSV